MKEFDGKILIVTGGASGAGLGQAKVLQARRSLILRALGAR